MRIERIDLREIRLELLEPFRISSGVVSERRILLAHVADVDGFETWAECVAGEFPNYSAETVDTAWHALREWFGPRILTADIEQAADVDSILSHEIRGHRMAHATLEMAVWAIDALRNELPLARMIGGTRDHVDVGISLGIQASPDALVERARAALKAGYRRIKLKIKPGADIEYVAAVRAALGPAAPIMADANNAYSIADASHLARLDEFDLLMIEQPLGYDDLVQHAALQRMLRTPICLDESITSADRARDMIEVGSGRIVNIKPGRVGGFTQSIAIHDVCAASHIPVWCGGMLESGIGRAYNVALASLPNFRMPGDISPSSRYWARDIVTPEWTMSDGRIRVPEDPGIGVHVDVDLIDNLTVRLETLRA